MINAGIVGIGGYSGGVVLELLLKHPNVRIAYGADIVTGKIEKIWPHLKGRTALSCKKYSASEATRLCDVVFLAVPHTVSMRMAPELLAAGKKVIDISADYRLKNSALYKKWYGKPHIDKKNVKKAVYGLPELYRQDIKNASLVANPGCYPTAAILALAPIVMAKTKMIRSIIIDAKSGVSGAGRKMAQQLLSSENESIKAYKALTHQHAPEIEQELSKVAGKNIAINFVPHLIPINRGILETIYVQCAKNTRLSDLRDVYKKFYKTEKFVRVLEDDRLPSVKNVTETNYCDIGLVVDETKNVAVIVSTIDNLMKGAAGQAVQNMNIMYSFNETAGLK